MLRTKYPFGESRLRVPVINARDEVVGWASVSRGSWGTGDTYHVLLDNGRHAHESTLRQALLKAAGQA